MTTTKPIDTTELINDIDAYLSRHYERNRWQWLLIEDALPAEESEDDDDDAVWLIVFCVCLLCIVAGVAVAMWWPWW